MPFLETSADSGLTYDAAFVEGWLWDIADDIHHWCQVNNGHILLLSL